MGAVLRIDILADGSKAARVLDSTGSKIGGFAKKAGAVAAAGAAAAGVAVGALAVSAIKSASETEQALGATGSIFGKYAGQVEKTARGAATTVGLATSEYANLANVLGAQLKNMGTGADELAPKTDKLIGLGADLAATFGGSTADAVSAVSSLLKGERDPIERYGVSIKAADVSARLAAQGLDGLKGKALAQAEAQATLALLTEQTSAAQGAFTRESGTAAGQQQRLTAQWENAKSELGSGLLPIVTRFATFLTSKVMPAVQGAASTLARRLGPAFTAVGGFITGRVVPAAQAFITWFQGRIVPGIRGYVTPIINGLRGAFSSVQAAIQRNMPQIRAIGSALRSVAEFMARRVAPIVGTILGGAFKVLGAIIGGVIDVIGGLVSGIQNAIGWIQRLVDKVRGSTVGKVLGAAGVPGFGFAAMPTTTETSPTYGLLSLSPGLVADSSTSTSTASPSYLTGSSSSSGGDLRLPDLDALTARTVAPVIINVTVEGALDRVGVAEQIRDLLVEQARRTGRPVLAGMSA